jgi:protein arginine kinase activator
MATHHITELVKSEPHEVHLCEECFHNFMQNSESNEAGLTGGGLIKSTTGLGEAELEALEKLVCPTCKITFREFRNQGRLGCAQCYSAFREELLPLLENIHGDTRHCGKFPKRAPDDSQKRYQLIKLRNDLRLAIAEESYEEAARIRDQIHGLEHGTSTDSPVREPAE